MYQVTAVRQGKLVRLNRPGHVQANTTAQILRDKGWTVSIRVLSTIGGSVGPFSAAYLGSAK